ncbi:hypothetical protein N7G274_003509 [Stereocaulon virgatum]|uniref:CFEM domain-containing protein n=1 Tax=Stereocaulon virgatum TaxID=373712 RepID=A0ABR4AEU1_9LECA
MQYAAAALALMAVPFVAAQSLGDLPKCALDAAQAGFAASSCQDADYACICKDSSFLSTIQQKIDSVCSADDQAKTIAFAQQLCVSAGTSLAIPSTGSSAAAPVANSPVASMATPAVSSRDLVDVNIDRSLEHLAVSLGLLSASVSASASASMSGPAFDIDLADGIAFPTSTGSSPISSSSSPLSKAKFSNSISNAGALLSPASPAIVPSSMLSPLPSSNAACPPQTTVTLYTTTTTTLTSTSSPSQPPGTPPTNHDTTISLTLISTISLSSTSSLYATPTSPASSSSSSSPPSSPPSTSLSTITLTTTITPTLSTVSFLSPFFSLFETP